MDVEEKTGNIGRETFVSKYVFKKERSPWNIFPIIYGFKLNLYFETIAITWRWTLNPEKPTINDANESFSKVDTFWPDSSLIPFTNSMNPNIIECIIPLTGIYSRQIFDITLQNITEPQTVRILLIEFASTVPKISPIFFSSVSIGI